MKVSFLLYVISLFSFLFFFFQAEDGIRDLTVTGVQTCALPIFINMDLPWNPAVLEQRIGRVYRLGQQRSVQVVNFVAEGTIEERMLSLLAFKDRKSVV